MAKANNTSYFDELLKGSKTSKKQVAVYLDDTVLERIDMVIKVFYSIGDKTFTRSTLIETAIEKFLQDSEEYLFEKHEIDISAEIKKSRPKTFDTVVLSATGRGFEEVFLGENESPCWYPCRISEAREMELKYIAIYRGQPISAITHYAKIDHFEYDEARKCKVCYFDGGAIALPNAVKLGNRGGYYFKGAKYTSLESLINATQTDDVIFG